MTLFGKPLHLTIGKTVLFLFIFFLLFGMGWFIRQTYVYYGEIRSGKSNPILARQVHATVSHLVANTQVTLADIARLTASSTATLGTPGAKLTIVEFIDFDCPYSRASFAPVREIMNKYHDQVYFVIRDFPIDVHPRAIPVARAARCAATQGKFWPYHDKLYTDQEHHEDVDLHRFAREIGLEGMAFQKCFESQQFSKQIDQDIQDGLRAGVQGTPTFFFNGIKIQGALDAEILDLLIKQFLTV